MDHGENIKVEEHKDLVKFKTNVGLLLFAIYGTVYAVFVLINTIWPSVMKVPVILGMNLAVFYGYSLIILAVVMSLIYNAICTKKEKMYEAKKGAKK